MSETNATLLVALQERRRDLELDATAIKARIEEVGELIAMLEHGIRRRPGLSLRGTKQPRKPITVINMPGRVTGSMFGHDDTDEPDPPEGTAA